MQCHPPYVLRFPISSFTIPPLKSIPFVFSAAIIAFSKQSSFFFTMLMLYKQCLTLHAIRNALSQVRKENLQTLQIRMFRLEVNLHAHAQQDPKHNIIMFMKLCDANIIQQTVMMRCNGSLWRNSASWRRLSRKHSRSSQGNESPSSPKTFSFRACWTRSQTLVLLEPHTSVHELTPRKLLQQLPRFEPKWPRTEQRFRKPNMFFLCAVPGNDKKYFSQKWNARRSKIFFHCAVADIKPATGDSVGHLCCSLFRFQTDMPIPVQRARHAWS